MNNNGIRLIETLMKNNKLKETIMRYGAILAITSAYLTADAQTHFFSQNKEDIQIYTAVLKHGIPSQSERILILEDSLVDTFSNNDENLAEKSFKRNRCFSKMLRRMESQKQRKHQHKIQNFIRARY